MGNRVKLLETPNIESFPRYGEGMYSVYHLVDKVLLPKPQETANERRYRKLNSFYQQLVGIGSAYLHEMNTSNDFRFRFVTLREDYRARRATIEKAYLHLTDSSPSRATGFEIEYYDNILMRTIRG